MPGKGVTVPARPLHRDDVDTTEGPDRQMPYVLKVLSWLCVISSRIPSSY